MTAPRGNPVAVRPPAPTYTPDQVVISGSPLNVNPGMNVTDLSALGAAMVAAGLTTLDVRSLTGELQQIATQSTMNGAAAILELVRKVQESKYRDLVFAVAAMPAVPPPAMFSRMVNPVAASDAVSRQAVMQLLQLAAAGQLRSDRV